MEIKVNNRDTLILTSTNKGLQVDRKTSKGIVDKSYTISEGDLVMLLNYYQNCKNGLEISSYISR